MDFRNPPPLDSAGRPLLSDYKPFWPRAGAYIIDSIIYVVITFVLNFAVSFAVTFISTSVSGRLPIIDQTGLTGVSFVVGLIDFALYFTLFEWLAAASPGKLILGMRVVRTDGSPMGFGGALVRALLRYIDSLFFALPAYLSMRSSLAEQRLGDKAADTTVVGAQDPGLQEMPSPSWGLAALVAYSVIASVLTMLVTMTFVN